jgi:hypothetical protein
MTILVFLLIILVQLFLGAAAFYRREKSYVLFAGGSVIVSLLFLLVIELKLHHFLRFNYGVSNTVFYLGCLLLIAFFFYFFKNILFNNYLWLLVAAAVFWSASGVTDLLNDAGILFAVTDSAENILLISGSICYLLFNCSVLYKFLFSHKIIVNEYE